MNAFELFGILLLFVVLFITVSIPLLTISCEISRELVKIRKELKKLRYKK